jgi:phosphoglycerate dehydrogenase-like enzyme
MTTPPTPPPTRPSAAAPARPRPLHVIAHSNVWEGEPALPADLADRVRITLIPDEGPLPEGLRADVLYTYNSGSAPNLDAALATGVDWVHLAATGLDRADLPLLAAAGRTVTNCAGAGAVPISEWVLAMLLSHVKQLPETWGEPGERGWGGPYGLGSLYGARLALLGLGGIGRAVATRALAFGMRVRALRRGGAPSPVPGVEVVGSLAEALEDADHVVVTLPLTPATRHLLDTDAFALMKPGVHLVNIARGGIVDQEALRAALEAGTVARADLDVTDPEPLPPGHWLYAHPRVRVSAHISYDWPARDAAHLEIFHDNLRRRLAGRPLRNVVDPAEGY